MNQKVPVELGHRLENQPHEEPSTELLGPRSGRRRKKGSDGRPTEQADELFCTLAPSEKKNPERVAIGI